MPQSLFHINKYIGKNIGKYISYVPDIYAYCLKERDIQIRDHVGNVQRLVEQEW